MSYVVCLNPLVYYVDNFLTDDECERVIDSAKTDSEWRMRSLQESKVLGSAGAFFSTVRIAKNTWVGNQHPKLKPILDRITELVRIPLQNAESLQIVHYEPGGKYEAHYDSFEYGNVSTWKTTTDGNNGQRTLTVLLYLNTPEEGGDTSFPELGVSIQPKKGRIVVFSNLIIGSDLRHPLSKHAADPVVAGEKWMANLWYRVGKYIGNSEMYEKRLGTIKNDDK